MRSIFLAMAALAMTAQVYSQTTLPAAPSVTAGPEFKGLRFDWEPVPGASWYQFEYRAHATSPFVQQGANYPASQVYVRYRLPLHLFDWTYARYRVAACNSAGCTRSNEVSVSHLRRDAVGYFKAPIADTFLRFGRDIDITPDGLSFVASAPGERVSGEATRNGAAYVFRRSPQGVWHQRARLAPPIPPGPSGQAEIRVSISADGDTVVMGVPNFSHGEGDLDTGEVYVFRFNGTSWVRTRLYSGVRGAFGRWVAINDAGDTIATPYGHAQAYNPSGRPHRVAIYKLINGAWQPVRGLTDRSGHVEYCGEGVLSNDGRVVAETCDEELRPGVHRTYIRTHSGPNWTVREDIELTIPEITGSYEHFGLAIDGTGNTVVAQLNEYPSNWSTYDYTSEVQVFSRAGGSYAQVTRFQRGAWRDWDTRVFFGANVAISPDGGTIAIGDTYDNGYGLGPRAAPLNPTDRLSGGVYIYRLKSRWVLANMVKPNTNVRGLEYFGGELSLNGNGQTLLVGNPGEGSGATGIGGDWAHGETWESGAVFMY